MIAQELILLGLLKESPKHGYEIKKKIKEILQLFAGVEIKSIYYPLSILEKKGLVVKKAKKFGRRPACLEYCLTTKGQSRFYELLSKSFLNFKRPQFSLDLSLYFLPFAKPAVAKRRLRARMQVLDRLAKSMRQMANNTKNQSSLSLKRIFEHNLQMVEAESRFLVGLISTL
ncbi:MAG: PadR family transcriptional regulator [Candidatus Omnitrophica bacterium]|nr:PadR family transcriptional regulator [Candidatus Omnitrophota bacterium]